MKLELRLLAAGFLLLILIAASCHQKAAACDPPWRVTAAAQR
jgi:hypothetical protein